MDGLGLFPPCPNPSLIINRQRSRSPHPWTTPDPRQHHKLSRPFPPPSSSRLFFTVDSQISLPPNRTDSTKKFEKKADAGTRSFSSSATAADARSPPPQLVCCACGGPTASVASPPPWTDASPRRPTALSARRRSTPPRRPMPSSPAPRLPPHNFETPSKRISFPDDIRRFHSSAAGRNFLIFVAALSHSVRVRKISDPVFPLPQTLASLISLLQIPTSCIDEIPPLPHPARYGNPAYRSWQPSSALRLPPSSSPPTSSAPLPMSSSPTSSTPSVTPYGSTTAPATRQTSPPSSTAWPASASSGRRTTPPSSPGSSSPISNSCASSRPPTASSPQGLTAS